MKRKLSILITILLVVCASLSAMACKDDSGETGKEPDSRFVAAKTTFTLDYDMPGILGVEKMGDLVEDGRLVLEPDGKAQLVADFTPSACALIAGMLGNPDFTGFTSEGDSYEFSADRTKINWLANGAEAAQAMDVTTYDDGSMYILFKLDLGTFGKVELKFYTDLYNHGLGQSGGAAQTAESFFEEKTELLIDKNDELLKMLFQPGSRIVFNEDGTAMRDIRFTSGGLTVIKTIAGDMLSAAGISLTLDYFVDAARSDDGKLVDASGKEIKEGDADRAQRLQPVYKPYVIKGGVLEFGESILKTKSRLRMLRDDSWFLDFAVFPGIDLFLSFYTDLSNGTHITHFDSDMTFALDVNDPASYGYVASGSMAFTALGSSTRSLVLTAEAAAAGITGAHSATKVSYNIVKNRGEISAPPPSFLGIPTGLPYSYKLTRLADASYKLEYALSNGVTAVYYTDLATHGAAQPPEMNVKFEQQTVVNLDVNVKDSASGKPGKFENADGSRVYKQGSITFKPDGTADLVIKYENSQTPDITVSGATYAMNAAQTLMSFNEDKIFISKLEKGFKVTYALGGVMYSFYSDLAANGTPASELRYFDNTTDLTLRLDKRGLEGIVDGDATVTFRNSRKAYISIKFTDAGKALGLSDIVMASGDAVAYSLNTAKTQATIGDKTFALAFDAVTGQICLTMTAGGKSFNFYQAATVFADKFAAETTLNLDVNFKDSTSGKDGALELSSGAPRYASGTLTFKTDGTADLRLVHADGVTADVTETVAYALDAQHLWVRFGAEGSAAIQLTTVGNGYSLVYVKEKLKYPFFTDTAAYGTQPSAVRYFTNTSNLVFTLESGEGNADYVSGTATYTVRNNRKGYMSLKFTEAGKALGLEDIVQTSLAAKEYGINADYSKITVDGAECVLTKDTEKNRWVFTLTLKGVDFKFCTADNTAL